MRHTLQRLLLGIVLAAYPALSMADSRCVALQANALVNTCAECAEVTVRELRPSAQHDAGVFSGIVRTVRLEGNSRQSLETSGSWMIDELKVCH